jgi:hypothetical protein
MKKKKQTRTMLNTTDAGFTGPRVMGQVDATDLLAAQEAAMKRYGTTGGILLPQVDIAAVMNDVTAKDRRVIRDPRLAIVGPNLPVEPPGRILTPDDLLRFDAERREAHFQTVGRWLPLPAELKKAA